MTIELTNEEKLGILDQHIKAVNYGLYGSELDLIEINAGGTPDAAQLQNINSRIAASNAKKSALTEERDSLV